ncbi:MAG: signal peptidase II [Bacteroidota bacterium]
MSTNKRNIGRIALILAIIVLNIGCDQQTKIIAEEQLIYGVPQIYLNDFFRLVLIENKGAFLSVGSDLPAVLNTILLKVFPSLVLLGMAGYVLWSRELVIGQAIAFSFVIGGGFSNIYDRIFNDGAVVDFMNIGIGGLRTGIFNFADVSIMIGLGLLLFFHFRGGPQAAS